MLNITNKNSNPLDPAGDSLAAAITRAVALGIDQALCQVGSLAAPAAPDPDQMMTLAQVGELLDVSRPQVDRLVRYFGLPFVTIGAVKRVHRYSLLKWTKTNSTVEAA